MILYPLAAKLVGERFAKPFVIGALVLLAIGALWWLRADAYSDGRRDERHAWEAKIERDKAAQAGRERQADLNLNNQRDRDTAAAQGRREEIDDATRDIPDQALTARQRARACIELRRQAKAAGRDPPSC